MQPTDYPETQKDQCVSCVGVKEQKHGRTSSGVTFGMHIRIEFNTMFRMAVLFLVAMFSVAESIAQDKSLVSFKDRKIDVEKLLNAVPFDNWRWAGSIQNRCVYLLVDKGGAKYAHRISLPEPGSAPVTFDQAEVFCTEDFSKRLSFNWSVRKQDGSLLLYADKNNNEAFNMVMISPDRKLRELSNVPYVAGYRLNQEGTKIAYTERMGPEGARFKLHVLDFETDQDRVIATDTEAEQMTWGDPSWLPDGSGLIVTTMEGGVRNKGNLAFVPIDGDEKTRPRFLMPRDKNRLFPVASRYWLDSTRILGLSDENGATNLFVLDVKTGELNFLTDFKSDVGNLFEMTTSQIVFTTSSPVGTRLFKIDPTSAKPQPELLLEDQNNFTVLDADKESLLIKANSAVLPARIDKIYIESDGMVRKQTLVELSQSVQQQIIHSDVEPVLYSTFDKVPMSLGGQSYRGKIHGYLYRPKNPLPEDEAIVAVEAFYGGVNRFNPNIQLLCAAGIHVFSPSPRGVADISSEFEKLNDGDLGGLEVFDVMYGGQFVSEELGIPSARIGVFGHSHGGYEAMRQLTFDGVPGVNANTFRWGWGIAEAGFSSIKEEYDFSNIQNWIKKESGDPNQPEALERMERRSPINHISELKSPILLIHGTSDKRVPYASSKRFFEEANKMGKGKLVTLESLEGTGHSFTTIAEKRQVFQAWMNFLAALGE